MDKPSDQTRTPAEERRRLAEIDRFRQQWDAADSSADAFEVAADFRERIGDD